MFSLRRLASLLALLPAFAACESTSLNSAAAGKHAADIPLTAPVAQEISIEELKRLLPRHPVVVGFDVDDTLIFSAPAFNALEPSYDANVIRPKGMLSSDQSSRYHEFWNRLNEEYDNRSIAKNIARKLLELHVARGDTILVISKRPSSTHGDPCTERYEKMFGVKFAKPVIFTELQDKTPFIFANKIEFYYGDSDSDITAAVAAGATPIRVKRSSLSYNKEPVNNGKLDEIVLKDSEQ